jgi:hypothetical protein
MEGYNVALMVGGKTLVGRTQDDLSISALTKESITKDEKGNKLSSITGHEVTFRCAGIMEVASDGTANKIYRDEILAMALKTGADAEIDVTYGPEGGAQYGGKAVITGYSESTSAEGDATYSIDLKVSGAFTASGS